MHLHELRTVFASHSTLVTSSVVTSTLSYILAM